MKTFKAILRSCFAYRILYAWSFAFLALTNFCAVAIPYLVKLIVDGDALPLSSIDLWIYPLLILVIAGFQFLFRALSRIFVYQACREQEHELRCRLMATILKIPLLRLQELRHGSLITNLVEDTTQVRTCVGFGFIQFTNIILVYLFSIPVLLWISPRLTFYSVMPYPILLIFIAYVNQKLYYLNLEAKERLGDLTDFLSQVFRGIHVAKSFHSFGGLNSRFGDLTESHFKKLWAVNFLDILLFPGLIMIASLGEWAVIHFGSIMIAHGEITRGDFLAVHGYIAYLLFASISVGFGVSTFNRGYTSYQRLQERFEEPLEEAVEGLDPLPDWQHAEGFTTLEVKNLSFTYPRQVKPALEIKSLQLSLEGVIGVCGPIGSGKTSFFDLLQGLYGLDQGEISLDGQSLKTLGFKVLRANFASVSQEAYLFSRSLGENVSLGAVDSISHLEDCLHRADFRQDLMGFSAGLETRVGERGVRLSLGQKQRVSVARALFKEAPILILDDSFSAMDTITEERVLQELLAGKASKTIFMSSHRISTLKHCDWVLVFSQGRIEDQGSPDDLLKRPNFFSKIYDLQQNFEGVPKC
jgi:ATP-binding cassette, subfamily B, multidrug efflux pump